MPNDIENEVVTQIQPIFPQFDEHIIRIAITHVRQGVQIAQGGQPLTTALLLPACIDFLLEVTQDFILPIGNNLQVNGISRPAVPVSEERKANNGAPAVIVIDSQEDADKTLITTDNKMNVTKSNNKDKYEQTVYTGIERPAFNSTVNNPWNKIRSSDSSSSSSSSSGSESSDSHLPSSSSYDSESFTNSPLSTDANCEENRRKTESTIEENQQLNSHKEILKSALEIVVGVVPNVDEKFAMDYLQCSAHRINYDQAKMANELIEHLFENQNYPKKVKVVKNVKDKQKKEKVTSDVDYYKVEGLQTSEKQFSLYKQQCMVLLANKFNSIPYKFLKKAFNGNFQRYARTYKHLQDRIELPEEFRSKSLLRHRRPLQCAPVTLQIELEKECQFLERQEKKRAEDVDHILAQRLNEHQYQQEGQYIECNCCFGEAVFEDMTQCSEGHLSCLECLRNYAKEAIYGSGKIPLCCLTSDCSSIFPLSQLQKALDASMFDKYQERLQEESLKMAELPDLVRCPSCDYAAEMPAGDKVFKCQNTDCMKETCRYCKEPWQDHFGIPCTEMESGKEKNIRVSYEEKMSKAKIRTCPQCSCGYMKTDGCNKMTCRCGTTMCYICRISKIGYQHFCSHPRDPGKSCTVCKKCSLWTDPTEDEERAVRELKEEAAKEVAKIKTPTQNDVDIVSAGSKRPLMVGPPEEHNTPKRHKKRR